MDSVVIDCDTGVDDALALMVALQMSNVKVLGVTCVGGGNTELENVINNTVAVLRTCDSSVPIFPGCNKGLLQRKNPSEKESSVAVHALNGFGGVVVHLSDEDKSIVQKEHAAVALCRMARNNHRKITVVAVGPLTNVALAMRLDYDFSSHLKELIIMGGDYMEPATEIGGAEFNFYSDAEAADIVLREADCPVTVVPFDTCEASAPIPWSWFDDLMAKPNVNKRGQLMNKAITCFKSFWPNFDPCDAVALIAGLDKSTVERSEIHKYLAVDVESNPFDRNGYGKMLSSRKEGNWQSMKIFSQAIETRTVVTMVNIDKIKRYIENALCDN